MQLSLSWLNAFNQTRCTRWPALVLLALAVPQLLAAPQDSQQQPESLEITVVDAQGNPIANCETEWRIRPEPKDLNVSRGRLVKKVRYGYKIMTDDEGRICSEFPISKSTFDVFVKVDGYGPYYANWDTPKTGEVVPKQFTIELDDAWTVGGVLVNEAGQPIANATAHPDLEFKKRVPGQLGVGTEIKTDDQGRWQFKRVPVSKSDITVSFEHEDYKPFYISLSRDAFEVASDAQPVGKIVASKGLSVVGTVIDPDGKPIEGALIRTKVRNDDRETRTDADGRYELSGFEPQTSRVVVSADSYALDMKDVIVKNDMEPVDFTMQPGGHVRVRVLDENEKGIPEARIFFQRWRGGQVEYFEFDHIRAYTDENGIWEWNEAPRDTFHADICRPDGMQMSKQPIVARDEEYVFRPPRQLIVTGKVIDAETKKRITDFRVVPGIQGSPGSHIDWLVNTPYIGKGGSYRMPHRNHAYHAHLVRIEADGYLPKVSRDIKFDEETVEINFELERGKNVTQVVHDADGNPVTDAEVVLGVAGSQINIENGRIDDGSTYNAKKVLTDIDGRFQFPAQVDPFHLIVLHEKGFAKVEAEPGDEISPVELEPWGTLQGRYLIGNEPAANLVVTAQNSRLHSYGQKTPNTFSNYETTTGKDGSFSFDRIPAGKVYVRREIVLMVDQGATEVASTPIHLTTTETGRTTKMQLGGAGVVVTGQLVAPEGAPEADWRQASVRMESFVPDWPKIPTPKEIENNKAARDLWLQQWKLTPVGKAWSKRVEELQEARDTRLRYYATVGEDGKFRIDDVVKGSYQIRADLDQKNLRAVVHDFPVEVAEEDHDIGGVPLQ